MRKRERYRQTDRTGWDSKRDGKKGETERERDKETERETEPGETHRLRERHTGMRHGHDGERETYQDETLREVARETDRVIGRKRTRDSELYIEICSLSFYKSLHIGTCFGSEDFRVSLSPFL